MKGPLPLLLACAATALVAPGSRAVAAEMIVARIGDKTIDLREYEHRADKLRETGYKYIDSLDAQARRDLLDGIIAQELLVLEGFRRGIDKDSTIAAVLATTHRRTVIAELYERQALHGDYSSTDEELRAFFVDGQFDTEVFSRHIICDSRAEGLEVLAELDGGADFAAMVEKYSRQGIRNRFGPEGWVGWFKVGELYQELRLPLSTMAEGEIYPEPVRTALGWHVFALRTRRPVRYDAVEEFLRNQLRIRKRADDMARYVDGLRRRYHLEIDGEAFSALRHLDAGLSVLPQEDRLLATWSGGYLTLRDPMDELRAGRMQHPAQLDSAALHKAVDNLAGRQIMIAEARRLGLDRIPSVQRRVATKRAELFAQWLFQTEAKQRVPPDAIDDEIARAYYDQNLDAYTRNDGKVTEFSFVRKSIITNLRNRAETAAMDTFLAELRRRYSDRLEVYPQALEAAFSDERSSQPDDRS